MTTDPKASVTARASGAPSTSDLDTFLAELGKRPAASPTLAELLMPLPAANPFSTMRASLRR